MLTERYLQTAATAAPRVRAPICTSSWLYGAWATWYPAACPFRWKGPPELWKSQMNNCVMCWMFIVFENIPEIPCQTCHMLLGSSSLQWVHAGKTPAKILSFGKQHLPEGGIPTTTLPVSMGSVIVTMGSWHTHTHTDHHPFSPGKPSSYRKMTFTVLLLSRHAQNTHITPQLKTLSLLLCSCWWFFSPIWKLIQMTTGLAAVELLSRMLTMSW